MAAVNRLSDPKGSEASDWKERRVCGGHKNIITVFLKPNIHRHSEFFESLLEYQILYSRSCFL